MAETGNEVSILDFTSQGIDHINIIPNAAPVTVIYDKNGITSIDNLDYYSSLEQLSMADNKLVSMVGVANLHNLTVLNLPNNCIQVIEGLKLLTQLQWLNLAGNDLKSMERVRACVALSHADLSDNQITSLADLSQLHHLTTLLLHGNSIGSLKSAPGHLPKAITILSLAENTVTDLNEVSYLGHLDNLQQLSIMNNPAVLLADDNLAFDYRAFVVNWCINLRVLDGYMVTEKEGLKAEWLYSQGKGRHFRHGQQLQLVQYLASVCPITASTQLERAEDVKLSRVLQQQRVHQQQLHQQGAPQSPRPSPGGSTHPSSSGGSTPANSITPNAQSATKPTHTESPQGSPTMGVRRNSRESHSSDTASHSYESPAQPHRSTQRRSQLGRPSPGDPGGGRASETVGRVSSVERQSYPQYQQQSPAQVIHTRHRQTTRDPLSSDELTSLLDAETRYLPLHSELSSSPLHPLDLNYLCATGDRPRIAPANTDKVNQSLPEHNPSNAESLHQDINSADTKFDKLEKRVTKPVSQAKRIAANFSMIPRSAGMSGAGSGADSASSAGTSPSQQAVRPTPSDLQPQARPYKRPISPMSRAIEALEENSDTDTGTDSTHASLELRLLKAILANRKSRKSRRSRDTRESRDSRDFHHPSSHHLPPHLSPQSNSSRDSHHSDSATPKSSASQSPYRSQYTPDKYCTPTRKSLHHSHEVDGHGGASGPTSDVLSRLGGAAIAAGDDQLLKSAGTASHLKQQTDAATKLQALWRGFTVRNKNEEVARVRQEMRARHAEDHIMYLRAELDRQRQLYEQEKQLRCMQLEAMKFLYKEIQELQKWKEGVSRSQDPMSQVSAARQSLLRDSVRLDTIPSIIEALERAGSDADPVTALRPPISDSSPKPTMVLLPGQALSQAAGAVRGSQKEVDLEHACRSLQQQVLQLQEVLTSMSSFAFQGGILSAEKEQGEGAVRLSADLSADPLPSVAATPQHQLPGSQGSLQSVRPAAGLPTAPTSLAVHHQGSSSVVLVWQPSHILTPHGTPTNKPLLGYRVYLNGTPKGLIASSQTRALLEGLQPGVPYTILVRAVSAHGESADSNIMVVTLSSQDMDESKSSRDDSDSSDEPASPPQPSDSDQRTQDNSSSQRPPSPSDTSPDQTENNTPHDSPQNGAPRSQSGSYTSVFQHLKERRKAPGQNTARPLSFTDSPEMEKRGLPSRPQEPVGCDSGYITPGSTLSQQQGVGESSTSMKHRIAEELRSIREASSSLEGERKARRAVLEKLEQNLKSPSSRGSSPGRDTTAGSSPTTGRLEVGGDLEQCDSKSGLNGSPRIQEGLVHKCLEGSSARLGEIKQVIQKRKVSPAPVAPLKAAPSEIRDESEANADSNLDTHVTKRGDSISRIPVFTKQSTDLADRDKRDQSPQSLSETKSRLVKGHSTDKDKSRAQGDGGKVRTSSKNVKGLRKVGSDGALSKAVEKENVDAPKNRTWPSEIVDVSLQQADSTDNGKTNVSRKYSCEDEAIGTGGLTPRPPDELGSPRKGGLVRRNSLRSRHRSGSDSSREEAGERRDSLGGQHLKSSDAVPEAKSSPLSLARAERRRSSASTGPDSDSTPIPSPLKARDHAFTIPVGDEKPVEPLFTRQTRGRNSVRESRSPKQVPAEKRASSIGAVLNHGSVTATDKPPTSRPPTGKSPDTLGVQGQQRRRTRSENSPNSAGTSPGSKDASTTGSTPEREAKKPSTPVKFTHKRSASADIPQLVLPSPDSPKTTPSTPNQCPSSPRVRRSSSFSKGSPAKEDQSESALMRQCISMEQLKAAIKSPEEKAKLIAQYNQKPHHASPDGVTVSTAAHGNTSTDQAAAADPCRPEAGRSEPHSAEGSPSKLTTGGGDRDDKHVNAADKTGSSLASGGKTSASVRRTQSLKDSRQSAARVKEGQRPVTISQLPSATDPSYSPKLEGGKKSEGKTKVKTNKAADLFAKLQMRLSTTKK